MEEEKLLRFLKELQQSLIPIAFLSLLSMTLCTLTYAGDIKISNLQDLELNKDKERQEYRELLMSVMPEMKEEELNFANELRAKSRMSAQKAIIEQYKQLKTFEGKEEIAELDDPYSKALLKVFVSESMNLELLKTYYKQATKYDGTLVFKGLPQNSFREMTRLVMELEQVGGEGSVQIDDEEFDRFDVKTVPVIILSKRENCLGLEKCKITFDKVSGNIGVRRALELFKQESGDLNIEAEELLGR